MSKNMVERVEAVIQDWIARNVEDERTLAVRVIEAMAEPTEEMVAEGAAAMRLYGHDRVAKPVWSTYTAMITTALKP